MFKDFKIRYFNFRLLLYVLMLSVIGVLVVRSATANTQNSSMADKQALGIVLGLIALVIVTVFNYHYLLKFSWLIYVVTVGLLVAVLIFGRNINNATRWIWLPVVGQFQPSEVAKISLIIFFAMFMYQMRDRINHVTTLLMIVALMGIPLFLIVKQPNLSTTLVITGMVLAMLFTAGISYKWILGVMAIIIPAVTILIYMISTGKNTFLQDYQEIRIMSWIDPEKYATSYYQQKNSITAIASGMLWGKGLNTLSIDSVKNGDFLPEVQTDFIFAVVGEELGFMGSVIVLGLLALIVFECVVTAIKAKELSGRLLCMGMAALIGFQTFVNIAVVTGIFPNTGIPLPFVSYGVTSLVSFFIGIGLIMNVGIYGRNK